MLSETVNYPRVIFVGAGDFGRELVSWFLHIYLDNLDELALGFIDDNVSTMRAGGRDLTYFGQINTFIPLVTDQLYMTITKPPVRRRIAHQLKDGGAKFSSFVHPYALIAATAIIGEGCILGPYSLVSENAVLDEFVIVNSYSSIGHEARVGACTTLSGHIDLTGHVRIGSEVFIGSGARVLPRQIVGNSAVVGAGAVVMRSVPDGRTAYASPAKLL